LELYTKECPSTVSPSSTATTPAADQAARSAASRSFHECTRPRSVTYPSAASAAICLASTSALRLRALVIASLTSDAFDAPGRLLRCELFRIACEVSAQSDDAIACRNAYVRCTDARVPGEFVQDLELQPMIRLHSVLRLL
jgi:hypothetical protein